MASIGFGVVGVPTTATEIDGSACYPALDAIPSDVDIDVVDVSARRGRTPTSGLPRPPAARRLSGPRSGSSPATAEHWPRSSVSTSSRSRCTATTSAVHDIDIDGKC